MAFRLSGTAWDGQKWRVAGSIKTLAQQVEVIRPGTYPLDGTVASRTHDATNPSSDHTVWPKTGSGVVYAIDIDETYGTFIDEIFEAIRLSRDPRLKYMIHNRRICSSYNHSNGPAYTWRPYSGYNDHLGHGHVSVYHDSRGENTEPWDLGAPMAFITVAQWQEMANDAGLTDPNGQPLVIDDDFGPKTQHALTQGLKPGTAVGDFYTKSEADQTFATKHGHPYAKTNHDHEAEVTETTKVVLT